VVFFFGLLQSANIRYTKNQRKPKDTFSFSLLPFNKKELFYLLQFGYLPNNHSGKSIKPYGAKLIYQPIILIDCLPGPLLIIACNQSIRR